MDSNNDPDLVTSTIIDKTWVKLGKSGLVNISMDRKKKRSIKRKQSDCIRPAGNVGSSFLSLSHCYTYYYNNYNHYYTYSIYTYYH